MLKRQFPKVVEIYISTAGPSGWDQMLQRAVVVYNKTEYDSIVARNTPRYILSERKPTWKELEGHSFLIRFYYYLPAWLIYMLGVISGSIITNAELLLKGWQWLFHK
jgi:hypothetical protein